MIPARVRQDYAKTWRRVAKTLDKTSLVPGKFVLAVWHVGPDFKKALLLSGINRSDAESFWARLKENGRFRDGKIAVSGKADSFDFTLHVMVAKGFVTIRSDAETARSVENQSSEGTK